MGRKLINGGEAHTFTKADHSKGGKTVTPKQLMAQKVRWLKKKGYTTNEDRNWFLERIIDPKTDLVFLQELNDRLLKALPDDKISDVIKNGVALHKAKFGEKHKHLNVNIELSQEDLEKRNAEIDKHILEVLGEDD